VQALILLAAVALAEEEMDLHLLEQLQDVLERLTLAVVAAEDPMQEDKVAVQAEAV